MNEEGKSYPLESQKQTRLDDLQPDVSAEYYAVYRMLRKNSGRPLVFGPWPSAARCDAIYLLITRRVVTVRRMPGSRIALRLFRRDR
jgi:hypothetical protein